MIYEETYRYLIRHVSSKEFDTCLYSLLHMDWDGVIQSPLHKMSKGIGTTEKYLKKIIKKFSSPQVGCGRKIFLPIQQEITKYKFNLGPTGSLSFNSKKDRYCKKYRFFYSNAFRSLSLPSKRLVLMAAFNMSVNKSEEVSLHYDEIVHSECSLFKRQDVLDAMETVNQTLGDMVTFTIASSVFTRKEIILASFKEGMLKDYLENRTERMLVRKTIYEAGFLEYIEDKVCMELERVGKYIYRSFLKAAHGPIKDDLLKLARFVYSTSLKKFGKFLSSKKHLLADPKQASAYFSTIVYNEALEQLATYAHQAACIKNLMEREHLHRGISEGSLARNVDYIEVNEHIEMIRVKHDKAFKIHRTLSIWCEDWVISRVNSVIVGTEDTDQKSIRGKKRILKKDQSISDYLNSLKKHTYEQLEKHITMYQNVNNNESVLDVLKQKKEAIRSYFAIQKDHMKN
ncbi:hypothetical protein ACFVSS_16800 [Peribacillus butanolivorans]|uniref:hypothetical protein n=1 Tax=Peribacillus butanolivorans TaxID=421767 RepID=UPI0036DDA5FB